ncbi:leucyl aminopeptidase [Candidatus Micrarchaeota archaeon]|nr:leucyl aminopeptidase [Candidatus Micrarchaeota archaeon]
MDFKVQIASFYSVHADARIVPRFQDQSDSGLPAKLQHALTDAKKRKLFEGKPGQTYDFQQAVFIGLGPKDAFLPHQFMRAIGAAYPVLKRFGAKAVAVDVTHLDSACVSFAVQGLRDAAYRFDVFKTEKAKDALLEKVVLVAKDERAHAALRSGLVVSDAVLWARDVNNQPGNVATPAYMAEQARKMGRNAKLKVTVLDEKTLKKKGFHALLAVGQGSLNPPRLVVLEYAGGSKKDPWFALVGKGITFDSGGISIKPSADMDKMKYDKSGACAVLGAMSALSALKIKGNVVGVVAFAENMPSGSSYRPGDIVSSLSGKSIEVLNTDAEGRLVLADALHYVHSQYEPEHVVDLATLTGACCIALGEQFAGLFGNDDEFLKQVEHASKQSGDLVWRLPVQEFEDQIKGEFADVKNVGHPKGYAGASTAAAFLKQFVSGSWAHMDIAGMAWNTSPKPYLASGATGFGVRLLLGVLSNRNAFKKANDN